MYERVGKRPADLLLAGAAVVALSPVLGLTALLIRLEDGGPVFYRQQRTGREGEPFTILKFRSMPTDTKELTSAESAEIKTTKVGRWIRRLNIDELPQLFNILRGDMSIVGPRPPLPSQTTLIALRHEGRAASLRPGLTGLAQVHAYDGMTESAKAEWDNVYAERVTFLGDLEIIGRTLGYLLKAPPTY